MLEKVYERIVRIRDDGCRDCLSVICRMDDFQFNQLMSRLQLEIEITRKYNPPTRPALDPVISTELGVYRGDDENIGRLLGYPECCIRSFSEDTRYAIDEDHLEELAELEVPGDACAVVLPSGFIPCSLRCKEAWERKLIAFADREDMRRILELEEELRRELPHFHIAYDEYFEKIIIK
ncbi:DUF483 domain-containing protein [Methanothermobacter wolfeii]|uniref:DUF483 domain-containing protein n=1 Tax=Methanothermobacter wolfeii TaxID=145261 RepID=A0A9E7UNE8_METWO|nr:MULTISPECIES: DUF483 domain-containing protein [Methanothermobacter]NLM02575.1 DUF483 domain-containing protein [Methanothermobacter wolfeii]QHN06148.1 DUF483 domain-containing protein [Methanothermobacter sp. THM-1]UXH32348.1 DUF483 domain-containing protein [Methanothermobacter wolfeii]